MLYYSNNSITKYDETAAPSEWPVITIFEFEWLFLKSKKAFIILSDIA